MPSALFFILCAMINATAAPSGENGRPCLQFESPRPGQAVSSSMCTVSVHVCTKPRYVAITAFLDNTEGSATTLELGRLRRPPYRLVWDVTKIPNQLFNGAALAAEAVYTNGTRHHARQEGIFITHRRSSRPGATVRFQTISMRKRAPVLFTVTSDHADISADVRARHTNDSAYFHFVVHDRLFVTNAPDDVLRRYGIEVLFDPAGSFMPYPTQEILYLSIPMHGMPRQTLIHPTPTEEGGFQLRRSYHRCPYPVHTTKHDFQGFAVTLAVPMDLFVTRGKQTRTGINCIVKGVNRDGDAVQLSWVRANHAPYVYSPHVWGELVFESPSLLYNSYVRWVLWFVAGWVAAWTSFFLFRAAGRRSPVHRFEENEEGKHGFERLHAIVGSSISNQSLTPQSLAAEAGIPPRRIRSLIKKFANRSFTDFVMFARVEVAKERLRSSHSSEVSIAKSCGFRSVNEMEKYFWKYLKTTPYKFRKDYHIT